MIKMEVEVDLVEHLSDLLASGDTKSVKALLDGESFDLVLEEKASDVIPIASFYLNKDTLREKPSTVKDSVKVLLKCAEKGNPKECLMEFLAQIESLDEIKFRMLLKPIQLTLLRIPDRKAPLMLSVFNAIYFFVNSLEAPTYHHLDKDSKLLLDCDDKYIKIRDIYQLIVSFYTTFVVKICNESVLDKRVKNLKLALIQALLQLLGCPIVYLDLEQHEKGSSPMREIAEQIVTLLLRIQVDPIQLLALVQDKEILTVGEEKLIIKEFSSDRIMFSDLSLSVLFYLIFCENMSPSIPQIYEKLYIFDNSLTLALTLLRYKEPLVLRKGLLLVKETLDKVEYGSVPFAHLGSNSHKEIIEHLSNIVVYDEVEENRKLAAEIIKKHFLVFEPKARFYILYKSGCSKCHPNVVGFLTTMLTNSVQESFSNPAIKEYFSGKRLSDLLSVFCCLKKGAETDLIENQDQIISALNLIIFLTRRDRQNTTGVWTYVPTLSQNFLSPLREGVKLSRAHYELQLKTLSDSPQTKEEFSLRVGGRELDEMSVDKKKAVINSSLTVFDLVEHLLSRAEECLQDKPTFLL